MEVIMDLSTSDSNASVSTINLDSSLVAEIGSGDESDMDQEEDGHQNTSPTIILPSDDDDDNNEAHSSLRGKLNRGNVAAMHKAVPLPIRPSVESIRRKCIVCLVPKPETEDVFIGRYVRKEIYILLEHLQAPLRGNGLDTGLCYDCMNELQRWHMFHQTRKTFLDKNPPEVFQLVEFPPSTTLYERTNEGIPVPIIKTTIPVIKANPVSYTERKMNQICNIYEKSGHQDCIVRAWTVEDLEYLAYHIHHAESFNSPAIAKLKLYFTDVKILLKVYCITCKQHISGGKAKYEEHATTYHGENPVRFPCDICGACLPDNDSSGANNFFEHWLRHFYFYSCTECEAILQSHGRFLRHMENVHKKPDQPILESGGPGIHFEPEPMPSIKLGDDEEDPEDDRIVSGQHNAIKRKKMEQKKKMPYIICKHCNKRIQRPFYKFHTKNCPVKTRRMEDASKSKKVLKRAGPSAATASANPQPANVENNNATTSGTASLKQYPCKLCGRVFSFQHFLQDHINFVHLNIKNYNCGVCGMSFISNCHLKSHEKTKHNKPQTSQATSFDCDKCQKKYFDEGSLQAHHCVTGDGPKSKHFKCEYCSRVFPLKGQLNRHKINDHGIDRRFNQIIQ
ncbi:zinc finger protein 25 isoform X1 [Folsomia candida]|uniref:zinc finger protein 25 isoform X1 n=1 Tax=Folsomia candida TaxID=158441 RepID=UPI000B8F8BE6|nr:zinc finger protein 25 isoform X1 [Folsomia candida]